MTDPTMGGGRVGFAVSRGGEVVELRVSAGISAAYDILTDSGYSPAKAAEVAVAAEKHGYDPETIARKMAAFKAAIR